MIQKKAWGGLNPRNKISRCRCMAVCVMVVVAMAASMASQTLERPGRITGGLTSGATVRLAGSVHPLTRRATDLGEVDSGMELGSLTLNISLSATEQTELNALLAAQQDANSPQYHQWLTQEEYGARFGLTEGDLAQATRWLELQGFTVKGVSTSRNAIYFGGTAWQVESAFHTDLHRYQLNGESHFANATELQIPAGLAGVLLNVRGLNDFRLKPQFRQRSVPGYTVDTTNGVENFLTPADWATIYNVNAIYNDGYTGTGTYVGVAGQTYAPESDITNFRNASGLGSTNLIYECISSANCTNATGTSTGGDLREADLDIEWSGGIAKNATVVFVYAAYDDPNLGVFDALQYAVQTYKVPATGKVLPVVSMSYSDCEEHFAGDPSYENLITQIGEQATAAGQTLVVSSGDWGPAACDAFDSGSNDPASQGVYVGVPADSPYYTGVGGTTLTGDESNPAGYWNETINLVDSALQYIPESVWNDTSAANGGLATSGGGVSVYYAQPSWQPTPSNYTGAAGRFVPDVAFAASPDHDGYMTCSSGNNSTTTGTDCATGFLSSKEYWDVIGGTSASTPSFAGILALLVQKYGPLGPINPTLYGLAANPSTYATVFHDVTSGNNIVPCLVETADPGCVDSVMGYTAVAGYDLTTGLGSINGGALYTALAPTLTAQTITFTQPPAQTYGVGSITLAATGGGSGNPVTFTVVSGPGTVSGSKLTITGAGTITVQAAQAGNSSYAAATPVDMPVTVNPAPLTVVANNQDAAQGATLPALTGTLTGVIAGDGITASYSTTAANSSTVGVYPITPTLIDPNDKLGNYSVTIADGVLEIYSDTALPLALWMSPATATAGGASFTLTVGGANFTSKSVVLWNGAARATTYVSATQLTATILASDIAAAETGLVTVAKPAPNAGTSAALPFVVLSSAPVATITGASLSDALNSSGDYVLVLKGSNFVANSTVTWNGQSLTLISVSASQITALVTPPEHASLPGVVTVTNPSGTSKAFEVE